MPRTNRFAEEAERAAAIAEFRAARQELDAALAGIEITTCDVEQVLNIPRVNRARLRLFELQFGYRADADRNRALLTPEQRRSWQACGSYKDRNGKVNPVFAARSHWLCWLGKRASNHSLPKQLAARIAAEYHHMTLDEYPNACAI